jgi:transcriptional regulator with XRE-family HTH domain
MGPREFGAWLREQRRRLKHEGRIATQEEIARRAGVSRSTVAMIEAMTQPNAKVYDPGRETVERLAVALGVSVAEALVVAGYCPPDMPAPDDWPAEVLELAEEARRLDRNDFELARNFIRRLVPSDQYALTAY